MSTPGEITILLQKAERREPGAADALYRLVEKDLRAIAARRRRPFENPVDGSITVLVDDAFCRLVGGEVTVWRTGDRAKFFSYVATKIHDLLVEAARASLAQKRGGDRRKYSLENDALAADIDDSDFVIDLQNALVQLEAFAEKEASAFRIHYFLGSTFDETAELLQVSPTEAKRLCKKAQLWLRRELKDYDHDS